MVAVGVFVFVVTIDRYIGKEVALILISPILLPRNVTPFPGQWVPVSVEVRSYLTSTFGTKLCFKSLLHPSQGPCSWWRERG